jgi:hypothetical protein
MVSLADIQINRGYEAEGGADEDLSYLSMESLFTPPGIGLDERRMPVRAYNHWLAMVENGELPAVEELRPEEIADFGPNGVLVDLTLGIERPAIVYLGERLAEECGDDREIFALGDVPERSLLSRLTEHCLEVVATHSPVGFDAEFEGQLGKTIYYRSILLPYSSNGATVDFVFGVISWKEGAAPATPQTSRPAFEASAPEAALPAPEPTPPALSLAALLASAREAAGLALASEVRSNESLYSAISVTYDLVVAAVADPAGFAALVPGTAIGDPVRTAAKLVFGAHHDKTRRSEIATVLAHARRSGLAKGAVHAWLAATPGGIKALVTAERRLRSGLQGPRVLSPALTGKLRKVMPISVETALSGGQEFALIVARRNLDGSLDPIGDAGGDLQLLERAAKRLLAG